MTTSDRHTLRALTEAVADDPRDLANVGALADWLEERSLTVAGERVRRLVPQTADILVLTYQQAAQRHSAESALRGLTDDLRKRGRDVVWLALPQGCTLDLLRPTPPAPQMDAAGRLNKLVTLTQDAPT